jgi:UDP-glucose 4-epimerase
LKHLRAGGKSMVANCGYGRGYSVREVVDTVKKVAGVDFPVAIADRRPGDPSAIVANPALIMSEFGWRPRHDDLAGIVASALGWEDHLSRRNRKD